MSGVTPEAAIVLRDHFVTALEGEHARFLSVVAAMPDEKLDYKPEERLMGFGRLALHVSSAAPFFLKLIEDGATPPADSPKPEPEVPATTTALVEQCRAHLDPALAGYRALTPEQLTADVPFYGMGSHPAVMYITWHEVHLIHHRGQMTTYLRVAGEKVPSIYGPTADSSFEEQDAEG